MHVQASAVTYIFHIHWNNWIAIYWYWCNAFSVIFSVYLILNTKCAQSAYVFESVDWNCSSSILLCRFQFFRLYCQWIYLVATLNTYVFCNFSLLQNIIRLHFDFAKLLEFQFSWIIFLRMFVFVISKHKSEWTHFRNSLLYKFCVCANKNVRILLKIACILPFTSLFTKLFQDSAL